jgi:hypothetical protein
MAKDTATGSQPPGTNWLGQPAAGATSSQTTSTPGTSTATTAGTPSTSPLTDDQQLYNAIGGATGSLVGDQWSMPAWQTTPGLTWSDYNNAMDGQPNFNPGGWYQWAQSQPGYQGPYGGTPGTGNSTGNPGGGAYANDYMASQGNPSALGGANQLLDAFIPTWNSMSPKDRAGFFSAATNADGSNAPLPPWAQSLGNIFGGGNPVETATQFQGYSSKGNANPYGLYNAEAYAASPSMSATAGNYNHGPAFASPPPATPAPGGGGGAPSAPSMAPNSPYGYLSPGVTAEPWKPSAESTWLANLLNTMPQSQKDAMGSPNGWGMQMGQPGGLVDQTGGMQMGKPPGVIG